MIRTRTIRDAAAYFQETVPPHLPDRDGHPHAAAHRSRSLRPRGLRKYLVTIEALEAYLNGSAELEKTAKMSPQKHQIK